jgi:DNA-binding transcriptional MerR regulator
MDQRFMQIGEVAERTNLTHRTLRFYEEKGLLDPPTRMEGGFRLYSEQDVERIEHILQLKLLLGFSLVEIKQMADAENALSEIRAIYHSDTDASVKRERLREGIRVVKTQAALIDQKIEQLQAMRTRWEERLQRYRERHGELVKEIEAQTATAEPSRKASASAR